MKKRTYKTYGKTTKQWDNLYNNYTNALKYKRGITKLTKKEFKKAWVERASGETVRDIARKTLKEDKYDQYQRIYEKKEKRGIQLSSKLSKKAFDEQIAEYSSIEDLTEGQMFVTHKQARNWVDHAKKLGIDANINDFLSMNSVHDSFWAVIDSLGGWEAAFEYDD